MRKFADWWTRTFLVISKEKAKAKGLTFVGNIYGDEINYIGCRSVWRDKKGRRYRVVELADFEEDEI